MYTACNPSEFVTPCNPTQFVTPCNPTQFVTPCNPTQFVTPCNPIQFVTPCNPSEFVTPCNPSEFVTPYNPTQFVTPCNPTQFVTPCNPTQILTTYNSSAKCECEGRRGEGGGRKGREVTHVFWSFCLELTQLLDVTDTNCHIAVWSLALSQLPVLYQHCSHVHLKHVADFILQSALLSSNEPRETRGLTLNSVTVTLFSSEAFHQMRTLHESILCSCFQHAVPTMPKR